MPILEKTRAAAIFLACVATLGWWSGCSLVVESRDRQCEADADCGGFDDAVCDVAGGVCVQRNAGCLGPDGCFSCPPVAQVEFLNACTGAQCIPYDNAQLEGLLLEDGSLPPLP